jgi:hypothetical protein
MSSMRLREDFRSISFYSPTTRDRKSAGNATAKFNGSIHLHEWIEPDAVFKSGRIQHAELYIAFWQRRSNVAQEPVFENLDPGVHKSFPSGGKRHGWSSQPLPSFLIP